MLCPILATYDHTDKRWCPTYHEDTEKIQSPDLKKSSWQIHPYNEPFYTPLSGSRPVHFMSSSVHICVREKIKSRVEKLTQKHPDVLAPFFQQEAKQIWLSGFPVKAKELLEAVMNTSPPPWHPQPDTHTHSHKHTHIHTRTQTAKQKTLTERVIYNPILPSSCVFPIQRSHACVDVHSPRSTASLYHRTIWGWRELSLKHGSTNQHAGGGDVTALDALSRFKLGLCVCVCVRLAVFAS